MAAKLKEKNISAQKGELDEIFSQVKRLGEKNGKVSEEEFWTIVDSVLKTG